MPAVKGRTHRKGQRGAPTVILQGKVAPSTRELAREAADQAGISIAAYLEALVEADVRHHMVGMIEELRSPFPLSPASRVLLQGRVGEVTLSLARAAASAAELTRSQYLEALVLIDAERHLVRPAHTYKQEALPA